MVYLSPAPLYHAAPLRVAMAVQSVGGTVVVMERFDPEQALMLIERERVTHSQWVPDHVRADAEAARSGGRTLRPLEPRSSPSTPPRPARST